MRIYLPFFLLLIFSPSMAQLTKSQWWVEGRFKLEDERWKNARYEANTLREINLQYHIDKGICLTAVGQYYRFPNSLLINRGLGFRLYSQKDAPLFWIFGFQYIFNQHTQLSFERESEKFKVMLFSAGLEVFKEKDVGFRFLFNYQLVNDLRIYPFRYDIQRGLSVDFKFLTTFGRRNRYTLVDEKTPSLENRYVLGLSLNAGNQIIQFNTQDLEIGFDYGKYFHNNWATIFQLQIRRHEIREYLEIGAGIHLRFHQPISPFLYTFIQPGIKFSVDNRVIFSGPGRNNATRMFFYYDSRIGLGWWLNKSVAFEPSLAYRFEYGDLFTDYGLREWRKGFHFETAFRYFFK